MRHMAVIWRINETQPDFAHYHPRSCGGKEQKANARLSANKKMKKENQIKTSASLTKKKDEMLLINIGEGRLLKYNRVARPESN